MATTLLLMPGNRGTTMSNITGHYNNGKKIVAKYAG
jgi:hypothetical protein